MKSRKRSGVSSRRTIASPIDRDPGQLGPDRHAQQLENPDQLLRSRATDELNQAGTLDSLESQVEIEPPMFPGARIMALPFRTAVETFLRKHYGARIEDGSLCLADLRRDKRLSQAIKSYKERFKVAPLNIPSNRDIALERFNRVIRVGLKNADRRDRDAANRIVARLDKKLPLKRRAPRRRAP